MLHPYYPQCYWGWDKVTSWLLFVFHVLSFPALEPCHTLYPRFSSDVTLPWKEKLEIHITWAQTHAFSSFFYLQYFFWKLCTLYWKLANTSFLVAKRRSPPPPSCSVQSSCYNHDCFNAPVSRSRREQTALQHLEHCCFLFFVVTQRTAPPQTPPSPSSQLFLHPWQWREAPGPWLNPGVV